MPDAHGSATGAAAPSADRCTHCGAVVPPGLRSEAGEPQFCCGGCASVYRMLTASGLDGFYRMRERGGVLRPEDQGPAPEPDALEDYDGPAFRAAFVHPREDGLCELDWHVGGIHCAACVWLLEQLPRLAPGVHAARVDFAANRLRVRFDPARIGPGDQARTLAGLGYRAHPWGDRRVGDAARRERRGWMLRFVVAAASAMSTMHLTFTLFAGRESGDMSAAAIRGFGLVALLVAAPALLYGGWPLYRSAIAGLRLGRATIELSVLLVVVLGLGVSVVNLVRGSPEIYADALSMFVAFLLGGRLALVTAREQVAGGGASMHGLLPPEARRRRADGGLEPVLPDDLRPGDLAAVRPGDLLPADGTVEDGEAELDLAVLTGEPRPVLVTAGETVHAGCRVVSGGLDLRCTAAGSASRMGRLLESVRSGSWRPTARSQIVDRLTAWYAPAVVVLAAATWLLWRELDPTRAMDQAMALILACCPCALGLATPLAYALAVRRAARRGLVIQDGGAVEVLAAPRHVVLDKTGTLTAGRFQVVDWDWQRELPHDRRPAIEGAVFAAERRSRHPIALALTAWLADRGVDPAPIEDFAEFLGRGLRLRAVCGEIAVGSPAFLGDEAAGDGHATRVAVACDGAVVARIALRDPLKPGADDLVAACHAAGAEVHLCSGDDPAVCAAVGRELGIAADHVHGGASPEAKAERVAALAADGSTVMIGDGLNDRLALDAAHVGVGLRGGMEAVMACCQVYVADQSPRAIPDLLAGARATTRLLRTALWASLGYNLVAVTAVLAGIWGPYVCAVAMPASSLLTIVYLTRSRVFLEPGGDTGQEGRSAGA